MRSERILIPAFALLAVLPLAAAVLRVGSMEDVATPATAASEFNATFDGQPGAPLPFTSKHWEIAPYDLWGEGIDGVNRVLNAQHGPNCEPPGEDGSVTHPVSQYRDFVYLCRDHIMTVANVGLYMTPDQMVDFSSGPAIIRFDVSTVSRSARDWIDVWIQAWDTQEQRILDDGMDAQALPRNAIHIEQGSGCCGPRSDGIFHVEVYNGSRQRVAELAAPEGAYWRNVLKPSAQARSTVEIVLSANHIKVWMPQHGLVWIDSAIPTLSFRQGVVTFGHHNYSAEKGEDILTKSETGRPNTWHWDNFVISPSAPFTIIHADRRAGKKGPELTFNFDEPAPVNSYLRFEAFGEAVNVSFDGGKSMPATRTGELRAFEHATSYFTPVPEGTKQVTFAIKGGLAQVSNVSIFARDGGNFSVDGLASILGVVPGRGSVALLVVGGSATTGNLRAALEATGCPSPTIAIIQQERWLIYISSAPAQVNSSFPASLPANTPFFVRCGP